MLTRFVAPASALAAIFPIPALAARSNTAVAAVHADHPLPLDPSPGDAGWAGVRCLAEAGLPIDMLPQD